MTKISKYSLSRIVRVKPNTDMTNLKLYSPWNNHLLSKYFFAFPHYRKTKFYVSLATFPLRIWSLLAYDFSCIIFVKKIV